MLPLADGCAGSLWAVPSEELQLGGAGGVGGSGPGSWISAKKGRVGGAAQHPAGVRMLCSSPPEENPQKEEQLHVSSTEQRITQAERKKKHPPPFYYIDLSHHVGT